MKPLSYEVRHSSDTSYRFTMASEFNCMCETFSRLGRVSNIMLFCFQKFIITDINLVKRLYFRLSEKLEKLQPKAICKIKKEAYY